MAWPGQDNRNPLVEQAMAAMRQVSESMKPPRNLQDSRERAEKLRAAAEPWRAKFKSQLQGDEQRKAIERLDVFMRSHYSETSYPERIAAAQSQRLYGPGDSRDALRKFSEGATQ